MLLGFTSAGFDFGFKKQSNKPESNNFALPSMSITMKY